MKKIKLGIVMLTYNRADVVVPCLESLCSAKNDSEFEIYILDNASEFDQYEIIKDKFELLKIENGLNGRLQRADINHGFPKGNNIGIKYFLDKNDIDYICLLNSDVILTDGWIDRIVSKNYDAVGPVTNSCGNEQTIPVPFQIKLEDDNFEIINSFAHYRYKKFESYNVKTDFLGFFCFTAKKSLFEKVGYLDERFGRGAFEDDDYCIRMIENGFNMTILRDVFVYHWGSSSFSQIPHQKLTEHLRVNKKIFEEKYNKPWKDRKWLPFESFRQDMDFLLKDNKDVADEFSLYYKNVRVLAENIVNTDKNSDIKNSGFLENVILFFSKFLILRKIFKGLKILFKYDGVLFLVRFPSNEDLKDGYFQRVNAIDNFFEDKKRFYINYNFKKEKFKLIPPIVKIKNNVFEIRPYVKNPMHMMMVVLLALMVGKIYLHSILRLQSKFNRFLFIISRKRILDLHGVVPEEFKMHGDLKGYKTFNKIEGFALRNADIIIGVTNRMVNYVVSKHNIRDKKNIMVMPILPNKKDPSDELGNKEIDTVIYCGGLQKWQQVDKMLEFVNKNSDNLNFTFLVPNPNELTEAYEKKYDVKFPGLVTSSPSDRVGEWYAKNSFGLILREDIIVNNAACPTKLIEYFQNDVLPIVDSENIGDFRELGFEYIKVDEKIPDFKIWKNKVLKNREVYHKIYKQFEISSRRIKEII